MILGHTRFSTNQVSFYLFSFPRKKKSSEDEDEDDEDDGEDDPGDDPYPLLQATNALCGDYGLRDLKLEWDGGGVEDGAQVVQLHHRARQVGPVVLQAAHIPQALLAMVQVATMLAELYLHLWEFTKMPLLRIRTNYI